MNNKNLESQIRRLMSTGQVGAKVTAIYSDYLRGIFEKAGKPRSEFYSEMTFEAGVQTDLESPEFGTKAVELYEKVVDSIHMEHLLVLYSVKLVLKLHEASCLDGDFSLISDNKLNLVYKYFERGIPLGDKFLDYTEDEEFLSCSLQQERLSRIK